MAEERAVPFRLEALEEYERTGELPPEPWLKRFIKAWAAAARRTRGEEEAYDTLTSNHPRSQDYRGLHANI